MDFTLKTKVTSRGEASVHLKDPGDGVIVERDRLRWLIMSCPCGCGAELPVNLDRRAGPAWRLYETRKGVSVYPSVWRDSDCKSHFIIWRGKILLLGARNRQMTVEDPDAYEGEYAQQILDLLSDAEQSAELISDQIPGSVPWDILRTCRRLTHEGKAIEGKGPSEGYFRRR